MQEPLIKLNYNNSIHYVCEIYPLIVQNMIYPAIRGMFSKHPADSRIGSSCGVAMGGTHGTHGIPRYQISRY